MSAESSEARPGAGALVVPATARDFDTYFDLRWRVLRQPWQQPRGSERDDREADSIHLMIRGANGAALAAGRLHFNSPTEAQVRFMAVDSAYQRNGFGSAILRELEQRARSAGATSIVLNARDNALRFYEQHGYRFEARAETLFGSVRHARMRKDLGADAALPLSVGQEFVG